MRTLPYTARRMSAVALSSPKMVRLLLDQGADVRVKDDTGVGVLHCACFTDMHDTLAETLDWVTENQGELLYIHSYCARVDHRMREIACLLTVSHTVCHRQSICTCAHEFEGTNRNVFSADNVSVLRVGDVGSGARQTRV